MLTDDELRAIAARAWGIVRASTTPELGVVAVHALQARIEGALREQATAAAERERVLREAAEKAQDALERALPLVEEHEPCGYYCSEEHGHIDHHIEASVDAALHALRAALEATP